MTVQLGLATTLALMTLTAAGYAIATLGMKLAAQEVTALPLTLMATGLICAALAEIALLRHANLAVVYLCIIGFESLLVLCIASAIGDTLDTRQLAGAGLLLLGMVLVVN